MKPVFVLVACALSMLGCRNKEPRASASGVAPAIAAPPPVQSAVSTPSVPVATVNSVEANPKPGTPPAATSLPPSVYEGGGTPAEKAVSERSKRNQKWLIALKRGTDAQKQQARQAVEVLPPAERAEFDKLSQAYGVNLK